MPSVLPTTWALPESGYSLPTCMRTQKPHRSSTRCALCTQCGRLWWGLSGKVMFTGYSQTVLVSSSAARGRERTTATTNVVAGAHLAGSLPTLSGSLRIPDAIAGVQFFVPTSSPPGRRSMATSIPT